MAKPDRKAAVRMEFHISRRARDRYQFDESLYALSGNVIFANLHAARVFAHKMNQQRDLARHPEQAVRAGQLNAMGLIDEILHYVAGLYRQQKKSDVMEQALQRLYEQLGREAVTKALRVFVDEFPPLAVYRREVAPDAYLEGSTAGVPNVEIALEELIMLWLANVNLAFSPFLELFDDTRLEQETVYLGIIAVLQGFFATQPTFGPEDQSLLEMLRSPAVAVPHSLGGQLEYIRERWGYLLDRFLLRLLSSLDLIDEEERARLLGMGGPGPSLVYEFGGLAQEAERFSADKDWMPRLVLIAKTAYVWLDQLSKAYGRPITRLDQIPDEQLDLLARRGFTGLWLIGLWERSPASKKIKEMMGNPEAVASAYSLFDYRIAADLGGDEAFESLRERAWRRGIRLASDMVPNHMGIDSRWVIEHPDWFISLDYSPYPSYTFNGPDLSWDGRVGIYLEDHYYARSDAAVVFKRVDRWTGSEKYIYHGNDGTSMPWNDTAQLNYLLPEVREAVIQTILQVARKFPIIRFDAAMTLAKRHYQRLWFPEPGTGGAIPSRSEFGLTKAQFDAAMPEEFWREVVDRVAAEVPDTLLLAEAFWLMEGYFVRTLGMHRVYNSAFMNMLRDEDNAKYRSVMKNTLEFDPEIMKRYVNFMNNPDERTAVDQFGKGDKYFGVCTMMATLPGLPMFGHGQIEGYAEKYGMEYRRAYWDERPDSELIARHERQIFPLLHRRHIFAGVENFLLYDFFTPEGHVNEDVFAYSNRVGDERGLVVYHNKYADTRGWVRLSVAYLDKQGAERKLVQKTLGEGLALHAEGDYYCIFRDQVSGLEYLRSSGELCERGLFVELGAYQHHVFLDFREVRDDERHHYRQLAASLGGRGVPSVEAALRELYLAPLHRAYAALVDVDVCRRLFAAARSGEAGEPEPVEEASDVETSLLDELEQKARQLLEQARQFAGASGDVGAPAQEIRQTLASLRRLALAPVAHQGRQAERYSRAVEQWRNGLAGQEARRGVLLAWAATRTLGTVVAAREPAQQSRTWIDEWLLGKAIAGTLEQLGMDTPAARQAVELVKVLVAQSRWCAGLPAAEGRAGQLLAAWLSDGDVQRYLQVNRHAGILWFNKEAMAELLWSLAAVALVTAGGDPARRQEREAERVLACLDVLERIKQAAEASEYQVEKLLELVGT